jgi:hypothetical protein
MTLFWTVKFLDMTPKAQLTKREKDKWNYISLKIPFLLHSKENNQW